MVKTTINKFYIWDRFKWHIQTLVIGMVIGIQLAKNTFVNIYGKRKLTKLAFKYNYDFPDCDNVICRKPYETDNELRKRTKKLIEDLNEKKTKNSNV